MYGHFSNQEVILTIIRKNFSLLFLITVFILTSCTLTQTIPSTSNLKLKNVYYENLVEKDLIIIMNEELYEKVLIVKPIKIPGAMG